MALVPHAQLTLDRHFGKASHLPQGKKRPKIHYTYTCTLFISVKGMGLLKIGGKQL